MGELVTSLKLHILISRAGQTVLTGRKCFAHCQVTSTCSEASGTGDTGDMDFL